MPGLIRKACVVCGQKKAGLIHPTPPTDLPTHTQDYSIQAGDIGSKKRGASGTSISGEAFPTEKEGLRVRHSLPGMVSMAGVGKVDSRFFFNLGGDAAWADDRYVAFGRVTKGMEVLNELEKVEVKTPSNNPSKGIVISDAGVL
jgi:cyclophilin family peptidyl-prolyl cis-trans isomerase